MREYTGVFIPVPTPCKAALDLQGFCGGPCRAPLGTPDGDGIEDIKEILASAGLL